MPYYAKSEDWLHQSALLLQARPSTTRITTRYHLKPARRVPKPKKSDATTTSTTAQTPAPPAQKQPAVQPAQADAKPPRGHLVLKTYDPHSGVTLKYKTSKAAEVTRLVQMLGTLGRGMAGLAAEPVAAAAAAAVGGEDEVMVDVAGAEVEGGSGVQTPAAVGGGAGGAGAGVGAGGKEQQQQQQGGGGGKKKKRGKK
ncbi:signal recognition particle 9 kDa protein-domain-containing protein [Chaetomium fimeti]|uniref:Signal recognition particle 9 kDa protein-domain-containing protein n=1 Tax=Chaetomium fimeti TaxID=1854472 RepID=A0AAE0LSV4_9PEZI|nr:signal recognition particle 9 kDa protein-domain-containing protein [Chaetomium fimeti]